MNILKDVLGAIVEGLLGTLRDWWREQQLKAAEAKAATLEAKIEGHAQAEAITAKIKEAQNQIKPITNWEEAFKRTLPLLLALLLAGCFSIRQGYNVTEMPIIFVPGDEDANANGKPDWADPLDTTKPPSPNEVLLLQRVQRLESAVRVYNEEAQRINAEIKGQ
jgi:hypothetical protein